MQLRDTDQDILESVLLTDMLLISTEQQKDILSKMTIIILTGNGQLLPYPISRLQQTKGVETIVIGDDTVCDDLRSGSHRFPNFGFFVFSYGFFF